MHDVHVVAAILFALALAHTFAAKSFERLADRGTKHSGLFHLLGEIEIVFGLWAAIFVCAMAAIVGTEQSLAYVESRQYTEPLFVFVVMVVAASRPVLASVAALVAILSRAAPIRGEIAQTWFCFALVPLIGSFITEPAAMTLAALLLAPIVFRPGIPEWLKYCALGVLFVNVSIGGTLTSFAAPPVLMVAVPWGWGSAFMASTFGWKAVVAVLINATALVFLLRTHLTEREVDTGAEETKIPVWVSLVHLLFLAAIVVFAHHPVIFIAMFLFFLGFTQAYTQFQSPLILKEGLLVGFFLAGLVVLGGMQQWWLQPIVSSLEPTALFFGAVGLTAITDNAALTYLGSLIEGMTDAAKYMLVAGAVTGGGLTVIANAPNPAGVALLREGFNDGSIGITGLFLGALLPTAVAGMLFYFL